MDFPEFRSFIKTIFVALLISGICHSLSAQITFEKGYLIDTLGKRTDCLIRYVEWKNNPVDFDYKLDANGPEKHGKLENTSEFGINGECRYIRIKVKIDRSSNDISLLSNNKAPDWSDETLFLKVLLEGQASLYYYDGGGIYRYFFSLNNSIPTQLICKQYLVYGPNGASSAWNYDFRRQLWQEMHCPNAEMDKMETLQYTQKALLNYFKEYNTCNGSSMRTYAPRIKINPFHLWITPGLNYSSISITNLTDFYWETNYYGVDFGYGFYPRMGVEAEYTLPFNRNKWGLLIEPNYQMYFKKATNSYDNEYKIKFQSIEFPLGIRYYAFLNKELRLFLDGFFIPQLNLDFNSNVQRGGGNSFLETREQSHFALGIGCSYKQFSLETRYHFPSDILADYTLWHSEYKKISFILGIRIF